MRILLWLGVVATLVAGLLAPAVAADHDPLQQAIDDLARNPAAVARDPARHPKEVLTFIGVTPAATVVEIWPGGGYWTEILAPYLHDAGIYYAALGDDQGNGTEKEYATLPASLRDRFASRPASFDRLRYSRLSAQRADLAPAGTADFVLTFRNLHNWMSNGDTDVMLAAIRRALKPGGIFAVEDHRARPDRPQDPKASDGYVRQDYAIAEIERAGFTLVASSEVEANPRDTTHWPRGVWTLPPTYRLGDVDRETYRAIGEADNFLLTFRKTGP